MGLVLPDMLRIRPTDALKVFYRLCILEGIHEPQELVQIARAAIRSIRTGDENRPENQARVELTNRWYASLRNGRSPDFDVYDSRVYLAEAFACWAVYSRGYLLGLEKAHLFSPRGIIRDIYDECETSSSPQIVDLGCGIGFSTAGLAQLCPWAEIIGTNVPNSPQSKIATRIADLSNSGCPRFRIVAKPSDCKGSIGLVFASEYFEHFHEPVSHLREVLETLHPSTLLIANTFTNPSIGHFDTYRVNGEELAGIKTAKAFNDVLREHGYIKMSTKLWNNRPTYWKRGAA